MPVARSYAVGLVGLEEAADRRVRALSGGQRRRLDVGLALVGDPDLASYFRDDYVRTSPDGPEHFDVVLEKMIGLWSNPVELPIETLPVVPVTATVPSARNSIVLSDWLTSPSESCETEGE